MANAYTDEENSVFIGKIVKYRKLINQGINSKEVAEQCAQDIIDENCGYSEALKNRSLVVISALDTFLQHVKRMDEVVAGRVTLKSVMQGRKKWHDTIRY